MIAQTPYLAPAKNYWNWLRNVIDIANQSSVIFGIQKCENVENIGKNPIIFYLFIVVVIKYSSLKMAAKKGRAGSGSGPKAVVYLYWQEPVYIVKHSLFWNDGNCIYSDLT